MKRWVERKGLNEEGGFVKFPFLPDNPTNPTVFRTNKFLLPNKLGSEKFETNACFNIGHYNHLGIDFYTKSTCDIVEF